MLKTNAQMFYQPIAILEVTYITGVRSVLQFYRLDALSHAESVVSEHGRHICICVTNGRCCWCGL